MLIRVGSPVLGSIWIWQIPKAASSVYELSFNCQETYLFMGKSIKTFPSIEFGLIEADLPSEPMTIESSLRV